MVNVGCVCALFTIILGLASTVPLPETDLNAVILAACPQLSTINKKPLPEECAKGKDNKVSPICYIIVDHVLELCDENKSDINDDVDDKTEVCSRTLTTYKPNIGESKESIQILAILNNKTACVEECKKHPLLCKRVFHLSQLLENKIVSNSQPASVNSGADNVVVKQENSNKNSKEPKPESIKSETINKQTEISSNSAVENKETPKIPVSSSVAKEEVKETKKKPELASDTSKKVETNNSSSKTISEADSTLLKQDAVSSPAQPGSKSASPPQEVPSPDHVENVSPAIEEKPKDSEDQPEDQLDETAQKQGIFEDPDAMDGNLGPEETPEDMAPNNDELNDKTEDGANAKKSSLAGFTLDDGQNSAIPESNGVFQESPDSHFFAYFLFFTCLTIFAYIAFHNKNKILALALEGRRGRNGRRRPNTAGYHKVGTNLEEAMTSKPSRDTATRVPF